MEYNVAHQITTHSQRPRHHMSDNNNNSDQINDGQDLDQNAEISDKKPLKLSSLTQIFQFIAPYRKQWIGALVALILTSILSLAIIKGLGIVIDEGLASGSSNLLLKTIIALFGMSLLVVVGFYVRFYLMSWLGERASADIREKVFNHLVDLHPSYFELNRSGDIMSTSNLH